MLEYEKDGQGSRVEYSWTILEESVDEQESRGTEIRPNGANQGLYHRPLATRISPYA